MFTGIIEAVGTVVEVRDGDRLRRIVIDAPEPFVEGVEPGDSIALDGACLTPVRVEAERFEVDAVRSTLGRTIAAGYRGGTRINLERALEVGGRLDGHLVQGHVDGLGELIRSREEGGTRFMEVRVPREVHAATILHGSIALNGVSLTVNRLDDPDRIEVALIPHTWTHTNFSTLEPGDPLNVEGDLIGKYVGRLLRGERPSAPGTESD